MQSLESKKADGLEDDVLWIYPEQSIYGAVPTSWRERNSVVIA